MPFFCYVRGCGLPSPCSREWKPFYSAWWWAFESALLLIEASSMCSYVVAFIFFFFLYMHVGCILFMQWWPCVSLVQPMWNHHYGWWLCVVFWRIPWCRCISQRCRLSYSCWTVCGKLLLERKAPKIVHV